MLPEVGAELVGWSSPACPEGWDPWGPEWWCVAQVVLGGSRALLAPCSWSLTPCEGRNSVHCRINYAF